MNNSLNLNNTNFYSNNNKNINKLIESFSNLREKIHFNNMENFSNDVLLNERGINSQIKVSDENNINYENIIKVKKNNLINTLDKELKVQDKNLKINNEVINEINNKFEDQIDKGESINKNISIRNKIINDNINSLDKKNFKINDLVFSLIALLFILLNIILFFKISIYKSRFIFWTINLLIILFILLKLVVFKKKINTFDDFTKASFQTGKEIIDLIPKEKIICPSKCKLPTNTSNKLKYTSNIATNIDTSNNYAKLGDLPEANWNNLDLYPNMPANQIIIPNKKDKPAPYYKSLNKYNRNENEKKSVNNDKYLTKYTCRWEGSYNTAPFAGKFKNSQEAYQFESNIPCSRYDNYKTVGINNN